MIRSDITLFDDAIEARNSTEPDETNNLIGAADGSNDTNANTVQPQVIHGSVQWDITFAALEHSHAEDIAFRNFQVKLLTYLANQLWVHRSDINLWVDGVISPGLFVNLYMIHLLNQTSMI